MPTYVYACQACHAVIERRQGFNDDPLTVCEQCSGELRRVIQAVGILKGRGSDSAAKEAESSAPIPEKAGVTASATESPSTESSSDSKAPAPATGESASAKDTSPKGAPAKATPAKEAPAPVKEPAVASPAPSDPNGGHKPPQRGSSWTTFIR
jgi:putative FmdB family regulatory protein